MFSDVVNAFYEGVVKCVAAFRHEGNPFFKVLDKGFDRSSVGAAVVMMAEIAAGLRCNAILHSRKVIEISDFMQHPANSRIGRANTLFCLLGIAVM